MRDHINLYLLVLFLIPTEFQFSLERELILGTQHLCPGTVCGLAIPSSRHKKSLRSRGATLVRDGHGEAVAESSFDAGTDEPL